MIWTASGHDIGPGSVPNSPGSVGTVAECAAACCDGFDGVACYGFSRNKAAADDVASACWFKGAAPEADREIGNPTYHTFYRTLEGAQIPWPIPWPPARCAAQAVGLGAGNGAAMMAHGVQGVGRLEELAWRWRVDPRLLADAWTLDVAV